MDLTNPANLNDPPTRDGYELSNWNTAADGRGSDIAVLGFNGVSDHQTLYAQWEKVSSPPVKARIDCNKTLCAVSASYSDGPSKTRTSKVTGQPLAWTDAGIKGIRLDDKGYDVHQSCPDDLNVCYFVSLEEAPKVTPSGYAAMAQTGDPAASWRQTVTYLLGGGLVLLAGLTVLNVKRQARRL